MNAEELQVFRLICDKIAKDVPLLFESTTQVRDIINATEEQEKLKYQQFQTQVELLKTLLRNVEDNKYRGK